MRRALAAAYEAPQRTFRTGPGWRVAMPHVLNRGCRTFRSPADTLTLAPAPSPPSSDDAYQHIQWLALLPSTPLDIVYIIIIYIMHGRV